MRNEVAVVAIGASAGGLDAIKRLLGAVEPDKTTAFIVAMHLDPDKQSHLAELLDRATPLEVREGSDGQRIVPGAVYTVPPGRYLSLNDGRLVIDQPPQDRFNRNSIDHLFTSLADQYGSVSLGIVLSGTGSDGAQGVRDIKAAGGIVLVQDPDDAEFDGMPKSAISTGTVDVVASCEELAARLVDIAAIHGEEFRRSVEPDAEFVPDEVEAMTTVLESQTGYDFSEYKRATMLRRLRRRMGLRRSADYRAYLALISQDGRERMALVNDLLIGVTQFFRDPAAWEALGADAIDEIVERMSDGETIRAWSVGCASGEEAYTLAILILERIERSGKRLNVQIFGSDLNGAAIDRARVGRYPARSVSGLPPERVERWFQRRGDNLQAKQELREKLVFTRQNALSDPPFSKIDLICCRNLLIYLNVEAQDAIINTFHFSLRDKGFLFLGLSESVERHQSKFESVHKSQRIFRRLPGSSNLPRTSRTTQSEVVVWKDKSETIPITTNAAVHSMLSRFVPPAILVNAGFEIISMHGELGKVLGFQRGTMTSNVLELVDEAYQTSLWSILQQARRDERAADIHVLPIEADRPDMTIVVEPVESRGESQFLIYFIQGGDEPSTAKGAAPAGERNPEAYYESEISILRQELTSIIQRAETSKEELQAANEEIMSANEELQSSNEELETSREELQSLNQELTATNSTLEEKVAELEATNDDLSNLIRSTDVATIFLDMDLRIRRFSDRATEQFHVKDVDIGRPLSDLSLTARDDSLIEDAQSVLDNLKITEREILSDGGAYLRRITPYRTHANQIDGVIITYAEVTRLRETTEQVKTQSRRHEAMTELGRFVLSVDDLDSVLERTAEMLHAELDAPRVGIHQLDRAEDCFVFVAGHGWDNRLLGQKKIVNEPLNELGFALRQPIATSDVFADNRLKPSGRLTPATAGAGICVPVGPSYAPWGVIEIWWEGARQVEEVTQSYVSSVANFLWLAIQNIQNERVRENERQELQSLLDGIPVLVGVVDSQNRFELANQAFEETGWVMAELRGQTLNAVLGDEVAARAVELSRDRTKDRSAEIEIELPGQGRHTHLLYCVPRASVSGDGGFYLVAIDIDERKRWERRNAIISAELDHRVKNILALVTMLARMSGRNANDIEAYRADFSNRIDALARTHSRLADQKWEWVDLRRLVEGELATYGDAAADYVLDGPRLELDLRASQSFSLAIHELTTNAVKYGAYAEPGGRLEVTWTVNDENLHLRWIETTSRPIKEPQAHGFGRTLIETAIVEQMEGSIEMSFAADGFRCEIFVPTERALFASGEDA